MSKVKRRFAVGALCSVIILSCNIFAPSEVDREEYARRRGAEGLILEGKILMREGNFAEALPLFQEAIKKDSSKSEAWYYASKCMLRLASIDLNDVWNEINPPQGSRDPNAVPFLYKENSISPGPCHTRCIRCINDTCYMTRGLDDPVVPSFVVNGCTASTVIDSVYLMRKRIYDVISTSVKYLEYIYLNSQRMDGIITRKQYESDYLVEIGVRTVLSILDVNGNDSLDYGTWAVPSEERKAFRVLCKDIESLDDISIDSLKQISTDPKLINGKIDELLGTVLKADTSYSNFKFEIDSAKMDTSMAAGLGDMIRQFKTIIPYYYYDDCLDNDGNYFNTDSVWAAGSALPAKELDTCMDRMIWIDWDQDGLIDVNPPGVAPHVHIGESGHRAAYPQYYVAVDPPGADFARYRYTGPYTYEFIFGDWGVDEEIMDGDDNTFDSLADEDSRLVDDTLDDDGDWYSTTMRVHAVKTAWNDVNNNLIYDGITPMTIATKSSALPYYAIAVFLRSRNPLDTLTLGSLTIATYTGGYIGEFDGGDWGIDEEYFDGLDNDGDGLIDEDVGKTSMIPPESMRSVLISRLSDPSYHQYLHAYWRKIQDYWNSVRGRK